MVEARNSIFRGTNNDVHGNGAMVAGAGGKVTINLTRSNYESVRASGDGSVAISDPATNGNQTAPPLLAADGFHELVGSPTVDAGEAAADLGATDVDGQGRVIHGKPDIGADELGDPSVTTVSCAPKTVVVPGAPQTACTASVASEDGSAPPPGSVSFATDGPGQFVDASCLLAPDPTAARSACEVTFTATALGSGKQTLTAAYAPSDPDFQSSVGSFELGVRAPGVRFAAPGATGPEPCAASNPCSLFAAADATGGEAAPGDEVVLLPGEYSDAAGDLGPAGTVEIEQGVSLHGKAGQPAPKVAEKVGPRALIVGSGDVVSGLRFEVTGGTAAFLQRGGVVEEVVSRSSTQAGFACEVLAGTLRDSACLSSGRFAAAVGGQLLTEETTSQVELRNVTAVGSGEFGGGLSFNTAASEAHLRVDADSVIASGSALEGDVAARVASTRGSTEITLEHSDYDRVKEVATAGTIGISAPGSGTNIEAAPKLDADGVHQQPDSPTIDKGATDEDSGATDVDGQDRTIAGRADIGADEVQEEATVNATCAPQPALVGRTTTCTATVTAANDAGSTPRGEVSFALVAGQAQLGTFADGGRCTLAGTGNKATCALAYSPTLLGLGNHTFHLAYTGDGARLAAEAAAGVAVALAPQETGGGGTGPGTASPQPPATKLLARPRASSRARIARFSFGADQSGVHFECKLDRSFFKACAARFKASVKPGKHVLRVRAVNAAGLADQSPLVVRWKVLGPR